MKTLGKRLVSLDVLRGFDLFCLIILCPFLHAFERTGGYGWLQPLMRQFDHVAWEGFAFWDLVMPLFMFMAGVSIPFAFSRYMREGKGYVFLYRRIFRRVVFLWILGMICQGNLLDMDMNHLKLYSNTLQAIAVGYLMASVAFLHLKPKGQVGAAVILLLLYWGLLSFATIRGHGAGDFSAGGNLAEWIDRMVLGRWRDGAYIGETGEVVFPFWYNYTWIISSLNFGVTVMTGVFAGELLKNDWSETRKMKWMFFIGLGMVLAGWLWNMQMPVIKRIWTSSMVLVSSGYCFWLMLFFYYLIDYKGYTGGWTWLKIIGMNSIAAYLLSTEVNIVDFSCLGHSLLYGLKQYMGEDGYSFLITCSNLTVIYLILYFLYKRRIFLKV